MPADFDRCVAGGGRVRTVSGPSKEHGLKAGQYVKYCTLKGKSYRGYTKTSGAAKAMEKHESNESQEKY